MALTTLVDILGSVSAALEAPPLSMIASREPFSIVRQSNLVADGSYWLEDGGMVSNRPVTSYRAARIDAITISVAVKGAFAREQQRRAVLTRLQSVERALIADGEAQGYHVAVAERGVKRPGKEYLVGTLRVTVD